MPSVWFRSPAQLSAVVLMLSSISAVGQQAAPANLPVSIPKPPMARQIEPMVAPVRRVAPKAVPVQQYAAPVAAPTTPAAQAVATVAPAATAIGTVAGALAAGPVAAVTAKLAPAPQKTAAVVPAQKIVVHTCRIGQDYSDKLKSCVAAGASAKSGVTKVASASAKATRKRATFVTEGSTRSALGAKRK
jgi:hypothetical protein